MITLENLAALLRDIAADLDSTGPNAIDKLVQDLREHVKPGCHVGRGAEMNDTDEGYRMQMEWYGGQLLEMVDKQQWAGINSWINCAEKFTTRMP